MFKGNPIARPSTASRPSSIPHVRLSTLRICGRALLVYVTRNRIFRGPLKYGLIIGLVLSTGLLARTGQPVPRFVSLRSDHVNVRVGPGKRYPLEWVFVRARMPVEVIAEFDTWRKIREHEGAEGWVHQSTLTGARSAIVLPAAKKLYQYPKAKSRLVAFVEAGVIGRVLQCRNHWCRLQVDGVKGWLQQPYIWGVYKNEIIK